MYELNWAISFFLFVFLYMCLFYVGQVHVIVDLKLFLALSWKHTYCKHTYWKHTYWKGILCHWKTHFDTRVQRKGGHMDKYVQCTYFSKVTRLRHDLDFHTHHKSISNQGWASVLFKRTERSLRSFPFFYKERNDLCVLFRSL